VEREPASDIYGTQYYKGFIFVFIHLNKKAGSGSLSTCGEGGG